MYSLVNFTYSQSRIVPVYLWLRFFRTLKFFEPFSVNENVSKFFRTFFLRFFLRYFFAFFDHFLPPFFGVRFAKNEPFFSHFFPHFSAKFFQNFWPKIEIWNEKNGKNLRFEQKNKWTSVLDGVRVLTVQEEPLLRSHFFELFFFVELSRPGGNTHQNKDCSPAGRGPKLRITPERCVCAS